MDGFNSATSISLLARIRSDSRDESAWREFVDRYGSRIYGWCLKRRLQPTDAEDVTQDVLVRLTKALSRFEYDETGSFRGWLRRVTENAVVDFFRARRPVKASADGPSGFDLIDTVEARRDLMERLEEAFDLELMEEATSRVRGRVAANRWQAWEMTAVHGKAGADAARELEMKVASVYTARNQVQRMIQLEVDRLERKES